MKAYICLLALTTSVECFRRDGGKKGDEYPAYMSGFGGYHTYMRDIPEEFTEREGDTLMRSLYEKYASEGMKDDLPTGHFWVNKADAQNACAEVAENNLKIPKGESKAFVKNSFEELWRRYDVNEDGFLEIDRMPMFLRNFCGSAEGCAGL